MKHLVQKYLGLCSFKLRNYKQKGPDLWNFCCPFCGDSKKNRNKARGYVFQIKGKYYYKCHNCSVPKHFKSFLHDLDLTLYHQYILDEMKEEGKVITPFKEKRVQPKHYDDRIFQSLSRVTDLPKNHIAHKFILDRKLPKEYHDMLYYAPKYKTFVNSYMPGKFKDMTFDEERVVIPFYSFKNEAIGWQGRALDPKNVNRYSYIVLDETLPRAFNLNHININKRFYVVEGPFDSMFLQNGMAVGGSDLVGGITRLGLPRDNAVLIYDNQPRNREIVAQMDKAIKMNFNICVWEADMLYKDINEWILVGATASEIQNYIDRHVYRGLEAELQLATWKKI
jgi:hypothetical protein